MPTLKDSWKFITLERLPRVESTTPFREVYSQLSRRECGGFILAEAGRARGYVKGGKLAEVIVKQATGDSDRLREYSSMSIGRVIDVMGAAGALVPVASAEAVAPESDLEQQPDTVFEVTEGNISIGWYLNHESVRETATKKTVFICVKGHRNPDSDHGTCYFCPFPIVSTESE